MKISDFEEAPSMVRAKKVVDAMEALRSAGFDLWLVPAGTVVKTKRRPRRWWGRE